MENWLPNITINISDKVFLKNPESTTLGKKIIEHSIIMIAELGFEQFTFKKLAQQIQSTEASVYRYFTSKHHLLVYVTHWYWGWLEYRIAFGTNNIDDPKERLKIAIDMLTQQVEEDSDFSHINEIKLNQIVIAESSKIYLNKSVDKENVVGYFQPYKNLVQRVCDIVLEINPDYKYPHMLVSTIIEGAHHQRYFAEHLPRLTDVIKGEDAVSCFYNCMAEQLLKA
ncbi:TetR/AcrR family transcriptional regulator [Paracrocinitomix mangrovi]|uniref:TetR/AcrR family transcriptional regulator n=1 Tax=Paracrocinitomix mangrovi TaxID=2862509 RepID=UPI001C8D2DE1|nr:TetR/AcrR family transcriptional regulator [Paracrocinitomix mangrovi]UKN00178.1 TetR/AcrR family transcriptional regulator [Paracrocinitomix mangrovi]